MILILSGSRNAGKTTVSKLLAERVPYMANLEVDRLREFVYCLTLDESVPINLENAASVAKNLVRRGLHVVLNNPLRSEDYEYLKKKFGDIDTPVHAFTLRPSLQSALSNRGSREPTRDDLLWIREQYNPASPIYIPDIGTVIDNSEKTPEEVAEIILSKAGI